MTQRTAPFLTAPQKIDPQIAGGQYINEGGYGKLYYVDMPECDAGATLTGATRPLAVKVVNAPPGLSPEKAYEYVHKEIINYVELQGNPGMVKVRARRRLLHCLLP